MLDLSLIVVGGGVAAPGDLLLASVREAVAALLVVGQLVSQELLGRWLVDDDPDPKSPQTSELHPTQVPRHPSFARQ